MVQNGTGIAVNRLFRFSTAIRRDPTAEDCIGEQTGELEAIAGRRFEVMRNRGDDVRELSHDGHPTACVSDAAFVYVNAFKAHVNVGFFRGDEIAGPQRLLEGTAKFMRHVKLWPGRDIDTAAPVKLIDTAYTDVKRRRKAEQFVQTFDTLGTSEWSGRHVLNKFRPHPMGSWVVVTTDFPPTGGVPRNHHTTENRK